MTAQKQFSYRGNNLQSASVSQSEINFSTEEFELFKIAIEMKKSGLSDVFIVAAVKTALSFEGVADL